MSDEYTRFRRPTDVELRLLRPLANAAVRGSGNWLQRVLVWPMSDGGMGSLRLHLEGESSDSPRFGAQVGEYQFVDSDGVTVIVSLNTDQNGLPYELDVWKTDFSAVIEVPERP